MIDVVNICEMKNLIIQVALLMVYGWLMAYIMPEKIARLMRTTTVMGSIQYIVEYLQFCGL